MEERFFELKTYCPKYKEEVAYNMDCIICRYNKGYDERLKAVLCNFEEGEDGI